MSILKFHFGYHIMEIIQPSLSLVFVNSVCSKFDFINSYTLCFMRLHWNVASYTAFCFALLNPILRGSVLLGTGAGLAQILE